LLFFLWALQFHALTQPRARYKVGKPLSSPRIFSAFSLFSSQPNFPRNEREARQGDHTGEWEQAKRRCLITREDTKEMERTLKTMEVAPPLNLVVVAMVVPKISATPSLRYTYTFSCCSSIYVWDSARELRLGYESFGFWLNLGFFNDKVHLELKSSASKWKESIEFVFRVFGWFEVLAFTLIIFATVLIDNGFTALNCTMVISVKKWRILGLWMKFIYLFLSGREQRNIDFKVLQSNYLFFFSLRNF
jgi:hypothetical protein